MEETIEVKYLKVPEDKIAGWIKNRIKGSSDKDILLVGKNHTYIIRKGVVYSRRRTGV